MAIIAATDQSDWILEHTLLGGGNSRSRMKQPSSQDLGIVIAEAGSNSQALQAMIKILQHELQQPNWGYQQRVMLQHT